MYRNNCRPNSNGLIKYTFTVQTVIKNAMYVLVHILTKFLPAKPRKNSNRKLPARLGLSGKLAHEKQTRAVWAKECNCLQLNTPKQ